MKHIIIKGIGPDRPGIVANISGMVTSNEGNIEESRMIRLGSEFSIIMMISIPAKNEFNLTSNLESIDGIKFYLTDTTKLPSHDTPNYTISLSGADNEGIVHRFTDFLTGMGINIIEMITDTGNAPITGSTIFHMIAKINIDEPKKKELLEKLSGIENNMGLEISLSKI